MTPVTEILQNVIGSVDMDDVSKYHNDPDEARTLWWLELIQNKGSDSGFGSLLDAIMTNGWDESSTIGWANNRIYEGHHRLVIAILLCMDEVPTTRYGTAGKEYVTAHSNGYNDTMNHLYDAGIVDLPTL